MTVDHVSDGKVDIPAAMIDAAREEWAEHVTRIHEGADGMWWWMCNCKAEGGPFLEDGESFTDADRHEWRAALAAAFAECEVRAEHAHRDEDDLYWHPRGDCRGADAHRLVITTPPVVVTPAQEGTANG